jgi:predicted nucleotidyltransferase
VNTQGDVLGRIAGRLDAAGIRYMIVGSLASSFHGEPRTTRDIDIVVDPTHEALDRFVESVAADGFYVDRTAAVQALASRSQFNVIDPQSGWKIDLIIRGDRPFSRKELERRISVRLLGIETHVATAEDTIVAKLEWAASGESERQLRDVASILAATGHSLDRAYLARWIESLGLQELWARAESLTDQSR